MKIDILVKDFELKLIERRCLEHKIIEIKIDVTPQQLEILNRFGYETISTYNGPIRFVKKRVDNDYITIK